MSTVVIVAGVLGLTAAAAALIEATIHTVRRRQYLDLLLIFLAAGLTVCLLVAFGHVFLQ